MSCWTHVAGIIRADDIRLEGSGLKPDFKDVLGEPLLWEFTEDQWETGTKLPCGSEGSLNYDVIENPDKSCMAAYVIPIYGDLRDFGETEEDLDDIKDWFIKSCDKLLIRNATLYAECSMGFNISIIYRDKEEGDSVIIKNIGNNGK